MRSPVLAAGRSEPLLPLALFLLTPLLLAAGIRRQAAAAAARPVPAVAPAHVPDAPDAGTHAH
jgi:hypothetical protein